MLAAETGLASPLLWRLDGWSVLPILLALATAVPYRGALAVADRYGQLLASAFDLHRFDMLRAMHLKLPHSARTERDRNKELTKLLSARIDEVPRHWRYAHPPPVELPSIPSD